MTQRVYRTLLLLYPSSFRREYGEDMVAVFEEMQRDRSPVALWWRVLIDAFTSITVQRMETVMSEVSSRSFVTGFAVAFLAFVALAIRGTPGTAFGLVFFAFAASGLMLVLLLRSRAPYTEPSQQLHRLWWRFFIAAALCFAGAIVGADVLHLDAWILLFLDLIVGWFLVGVGVILSVIHVVHLVRRRGVLGVE